MTDAKREALAQALHYHNSGAHHSYVGQKIVKQPTADQVIATAKKFEAFLDPHHKARELR